MALCDITTTPQPFASVDSSHFRQFFPQIRIESHGLLQKSGTVRKTPHLGQLDFMAENDNKKIYFCQRCLNHGSRLPRKNHKCECPYADCKCKLCFLVEKRRQLNSQLHDLEVIELETMKRSEDDDQQPPSNSDVDRMVRVKGALATLESPTGFNDPNIIQNLKRVSNPAVVLPLDRVIDKLPLAAQNSVREIAKRSNVEDDETSLLTVRTEAPSDDFDGYGNVRPSGHHNTSVWRCFDAALSERVVILPKFPSNVQQKAQQGPAVTPGIAPRNHLSVIYPPNIRGVMN
ncbi:unnamed protein product [Haemonchus placei]|uniref:DM domain-containing protein n=1 Tax=Haemonchus placei TaxID=6290 RepID=A0A0N4W5D4_HAEPC|nr:unnamed protein product [Haemonchus placei]